MGLLISANSIRFTMWWCSLGFELWVTFVSQVWSESEAKWEVNIEVFVYAGKTFIQCSSQPTIWQRPRGKLAPNCYFSLRQKNIRNAFLSKYKPRTRGTLRYDNDGYPQVENQLRSGFSWSRSFSEMLPSWTLSRTNCLACYLGVGKFIVW